jgi:CheY-like chemotaxis protein
VAAESADLILMDIEMPEMDGLEASVRIREAERLEGRAAVPIVALTGHTADDYLQRCLDAGCTGFLTKPVRREVLLQHVSAALGHPADVP